MRGYDEFLISRAGPDAGQPGLPCQPRPEMPWGFAPKKLSPFRFRQFGDSLEIHLNAGLEGFLGFLKRVAFDGDIEVGTNSLPAVAIAVGIAP